MSARSFGGLGARWSFPISARLLGEGNTGDSHIHFLEEVVSVLQNLRCQLGVSRGSCCQVTSCQVAWG